MGEERRDWLVIITEGAERPRTGRPLGGPVPELPDTPEGNFARWLRMQRLERRLSQADLAGEMTRLGHAWHQTTVAKTERAEREPRYTELLALAQALAVNVESLVKPSDAHEFGPNVEMKRYRLEQEDQLVRLRLQYLERDLADLEAQREALRERLTQLHDELQTVGGSEADQKQT